MEVVWCERRSSRECEAVRDAIPIKNRKFKSGYKSFMIVAAFVAGSSI